MRVGDRGHIRREAEFVWKIFVRGQREGRIVTGACERRSCGGQGDATGDGNLRADHALTEQPGLGAHDVIVRPREGASITLELPRLPRVSIGGETQLEYFGDSKRTRACGPENVLSLAPSSSADSNV